MGKSIIGIAESILTTALEYFNNRFQLMKLKLADRLSNIIAAIVLGILLLIFFILFFIIFNIGLALLIGHLLGHTYLGFLIVSIFYLAAGFILFIARNKLIKAPISAVIIKILFKNANSEDKEP